MALSFRYFMLFCFVLGCGAAPANPVSLLVNFFNSLYFDGGLDFQYDFGETSSSIRGVGLISVWGPMELRKSSFVTNADEFTKLVSIELYNKEHILINANTYDDLKLHGCQIRLQFAVENNQGTTIRPISAVVDNCEKISFTDGSAPNAEDILPAVSKALLSTAKQHLEVYYEGSPQLESLGLHGQQQLFAALLYYS